MFEFGGINMSRMAIGGKIKNKNSCLDELDRLVTTMNIFESMY